MSMKFRSMMISLYALLLIQTACVTGKEFEDLATCEETEGLRIWKVEEFTSTIGDEVTVVQEDIGIKLYVTSSDRLGNIYGAIYLQDDPVSPSMGFELRTELSDAYLLYPRGASVYLRLKGLFVRKSKGGVQVGTKWSSFGNLSIGRLPVQITKKHLIASCAPLVNITPKDLELNSLNSQWQYMYVRFQGLQLSSNELCDQFAERRETTVRKLIACDGNTLDLVNSGYSDFYDQTMPSGMGATSGILTYKGQAARLVLNTMDDMIMDGQRCEGFVYDCNELTIDADNKNDQLIISEIADPVNTTSEINSRFIELYNAGEQVADLSGWELRRYTNANSAYTESSVIYLPGFLLAPGATFVIAANGAHFEQVYGFSPNKVGGSSSAADSNGDDNIVLVDEVGQHRDVFGIPGEDGTATNHDFQDGRAVRKPGVVAGSDIFMAEEWEICNAHGEHQTVLGEKRAPDDFDPGEHDHES
ncbi:lamin tail domain-containing protein [Robertkochia marina]|uniref:Lamin tail domain-containing protein n=1 Tax=Robertkochia marina TaxID=1227945 RepID=A0A4S3M5L9_9FLAO|nr:DUF5689 domain-containing protein [Robertkochia marina]THD69517.1 lamin tail domain-containing protein [Robertkochia marina]TRZ47224.1 lamin tail domain-containing protein [Robertkochia marina]